MRFWLIYRKADVEKNKGYIECYEKLAPKYGFECRLVLKEEIICGVKDGNLFVEGPEPLPVFAIVRTINPDLSHALEACGVKCLNSAEVSEICNNKAYTYKALAGLGIPMPDTVFVKNEFLREYLASCPVNSVVKAVAGHGGSQVVLYNGDIDATMNIMGSSDVVIQNRIGKKAKDLRVYIVGNKILAAVLRTSNEDFRANFSLGGNVSLYTLNQDELDIVDKILNKFNFCLVGIDFLLDDNDNLIFNEIEDVVGARMLYKCSDIDIVEEYLKYIATLF